MKTPHATARPIRRWVAIALASILAATGAIAGTALPAAAAGPYTITGTLYGETASGTAPLPFTYLDAFDVDLPFGGDNQHSANTNEFGQFTIEIPAPAEYTIRFNCDTCNTDFVWEYLGHVKSDWDADTVTISDAAPTASVDFTLSAPSTISGVLVDELGSPLAGASVSAHRPASYNGQYDVTDENGVFTITGVPSGENVIETSPWDDSTLEDRKYYATSYFGGGTEIADATVINVAPGSTTGGKDFSAVLLPTFKARFVDEDGDPISGIYISRWTLNEQTGVYEDPRSGESLGSNADGWYGWSTRPGETYKYFFSDQYLPSVENQGEQQTRPERYESEWYNNASTLGTATPVTFADGSVEQKKVTVTLVEHAGAPTYLGGLEILRDPYDPQYLYSTAYTSFSPATVQIKREWFRDGVPVTDVSNSYELSEADAGADITVRVTATTAATVEDQTSGNTTVRTSPVFSVPGEQFTSTPTPTISGSAVVGSTLTADPKTWQPVPATRTYQWLRDGEPIAGATALTYTLVAADLGAVISFSTTGDLAGYDAVTTASAPTSAVLGVFTAPATIAKPTGTPSYGQTLTAVTGTWTPTPDSYLYQWFRDGEAISGATAATYTLATADIAAIISVQVRAVKAGYQVSSGKTSLTTDTVVGATLTRLNAASLSGTTVVGSTLTATPATYSPANTSTFAWLRGSEVISGETASTYTLTTADVGSTISFQQTFDELGGYKTPVPAKVTSAVVTAEALFTTAKPTISGSAKVGSTLTAKTGTWVPADATYSYAWTVGTTVVAETGPTLEILAGYKGKAISVAVTGTKSGYEPATSVASAKTAAVVTGTLTYGTPKLGGSAKVGGVITVNKGTWGPGEVTFAYKWLRNGKAISGATNASYTVGAADLGAKISVQVKGGKSGFTSVTRTSNVSKAIARGSIAGSKPVITGTPRVGSKLVADASTWGPGTIKKTYQWYLNGKAISKATAATYTVPASALKGKIAVRVVGSRAGFTTVTKTTSAVTIAAGVFTKGTPTVAGDVAVGSTLTGARGAWSPVTGTTFSYQWFAKDGETGTPAAIAGATKGTYKVTAAYQSSHIALRVVAKRSGFTSVSSLSAYATPVGAE